MPLLELEDVEARYGALRAVRGLNLAVPEGSCCAILGPNGAGKTTTLRVMCGLLRPWRGAVRLQGRRVDGLPPHVLAELGVVCVPEGRAVFPSLTVEENLLLAADGGRERVVRLFPVLGERLRQPAGTLSGGEQRMLSLARALGADPRLLLLDEPSLGLAPRAVEEVYAAIRALREEGRTIVLVEQQVPRALALADYVYLLANGELAFAGEPAELRQNPALLRAYLGQGIPRGGRRR